jgi:cytochrome oxidase Cu insertion factor (SCO1/SenC/PrrC family)
MTSYRLRTLVAAGLTLVLAVLSAAPATTQPKVLDDLMMELNIAPLTPYAPPPLEVTTLAGAPVSLASIKNQAVLVYFWATW